MTIRSSLILSYLALVVMITLGLLLSADMLLNRLKVRSVTISDEALVKLTVANFEMFKEKLALAGEKMVEAAAEDVAGDLAYFLKGRQSYNYEQLRQDEALRFTATQDIYYDGVAVGYFCVYDRKEEIIWHPNREIEGKNFAEWKDQFPAMHKCVTESLKKNKVTNYCLFLDKDNKKMNKFIILVKIIKTPFRVAAVVNINKLFLSDYNNIEKVAAKRLNKTKRSLENSAGKINRQVKVAGLLVGLGLSLVAGLAGFLFAAAISRPILRLRDGVNQVGEGDFSVTVPASGAKEMIQLAQSFNYLGQQLTEYMEKRDFIRDTFGRYVSQEVVRQLLESSNGLEMGGETREVTILMSDLRGFTALIADIEPKQAIAFMNRYLGKMIDVLTDHRAVIDEIMGDGILAFFGAPEAQKDHPERAVACALQMQVAMDELNSENEIHGFPHLEMGIAVNTGNVVVGNIGSEKRTKYGLLGAEVNFTGRTETFSIGGQVLISPSTYSRTRDFVEVGETMEVQMKGVPGITTLYDIQGIRGPYNIRLRERERNLRPLPEPIAAQIYRLSHKKLTGEMGSARITQISETEALVRSEMELIEWDDVRLHLELEKLPATAGKIYAKVMSVKPSGEGLWEAHLHFTSIPSQLYRFFQEFLG